MVSDAIVRYRLDDDSNNPEVVQAIKDSARTLYSGNLGSLESECFNLSGLTTFAASVETVRLVHSTYGITQVKH